jgi:hypothetical protein
VGTAHPTPTDLDKITGLTGFFFIAGHYPVDPVDPVKK